MTWRRRGENMGNVLVTLFVSLIVAVALIVAGIATVAVISQAKAMKEGEIEFNPTFIAVALAITIFTLLTLKVAIVDMPLSIAIIGIGVIILWKKTKGTD